MDNDDPIFSEQATEFSFIERYETDKKFKDFIDGIRSYKLTQKQIEESGFYYAGGRPSPDSVIVSEDGKYNHEKHVKYWQMRYGAKLCPPYRNKCVCKVPIKYNCYITDDDELFLVIGRCCIERFIPKDKQGRTCSNCKKAHRNRKDNLCKGCRNDYSQCGECRVAIQKYNTVYHNGKIMCKECWKKNTSSIPLEVGGLRGGVAPCFESCLICNDEYDKTQLKDNICKICVTTIENDHFNSYFMKDQNCGNNTCKLCF